MRSPLVYLTVVKLKNQLKEAVKHPAKLFYVVFLAAMLILSAIGGRDTEMELRPLYELTAIMVLFYSLMFLMTFINGLNGGAGNYPMFTLSDVSMLFPSPLKPNKVLFYGLTRQLGLSLLLGFFLLFQYSWLHAAYGVGYVHLVMIVLGYALCLFLGQVCAMAAYTRTSGNDNARRVVRYFVYGITVGFVALLVYSCMPQITVGANSDEMFSFALYGAIDAGAEFLSTVGVFFPVSGWAAGLIGGAYGCAVLVKGGHDINDANDFLYMDGECRWFEGKRIDNPNTHGTGCTLSSAIAANLAKGFNLTESVARAKEYVSGALADMLDLGKGCGPMNHAFDLAGRFGG